MRLRYIIPFLLLTACAAQTTASPTTPLYLCSRLQGLVCIKWVAQSPPTLTVGSITTLPAGSQATASITGVSPNFVVSFGIPAGEPGTPATSPTISIGSVTALPPGGLPTVEATPTPTGVALNFGLVSGNQGIPGNPGPMIPGLTLSSDGKTLTWDGTFVIDNGGTMYNCSPGSGVLQCVAQ